MTTENSLWYQLVRYPMADSDKVKISEEDIILKTDTVWKCPGSGYDKIRDRPKFIVLWILRAIEPPKEKEKE